MSNFINQEISNNQDPNEIHYFLWCSHGGTVAAENNLYNVETGVHAVMFYGNQFEKIGSELLSEAFDYDDNTKKYKYTGFDKLLTGGCPTISYQEIVNERVVLKTLLPPIVFYVDKEKDLTTFVSNTNDKINYSDVMGLHYFNIRIENNSYKIHETKKIITSDDILRQKVFTYSLIFNKIKRFCEQPDRKILPAHAIVGIYACRSFIEKYNGDYVPISLNRFLPKFANQNKHMPINLNYTWDSTNPNICISPCLVEGSNVILNEQWKALASLRHQGCALNALSFYSVISRARAREEAVCLGIKGTSIIEICKYINDYLLRMNITRSFIILRFDVKFGIHSLLNFFYNSKGLTREATIVKFYFTLDHEKHGKRKFSNIGHTAAFGVYSTNDNNKTTKIIYFIDPQEEHLINIHRWNPDDTTESITDDVIKKFDEEFYKKYADFQFMDIIFVLDEKNNFDKQERRCLNGTDVRNYITDKKIISSSLYENDPTKIGIVEKDLSGGMKKRKKKTNKKKPSKKRNTRKRRCYTGGDLFTAITKKIDQKNNVPNLID